MLSFFLFNLFYLHNLNTIFVQDVQRFNFDRVGLKIFRNKKLDLKDKDKRKCIYICHLFNMNICHIIIYENF